MSRIANFPEINLAVLSFAFHFVWEALQVPTYAGMAEMAHWPATLLCTRATVGDIGFALTAFWITALAARSRRWFMNPQPWHITLFLGIGIALTIGFEWYYVEVSGRWIYSDLMPLVPPFGTGLSPLAQWIVVPLLVLFILRRQTAGADALSGEPVKHEDDL
jgi:hypothetical protein